jgi:hypothetical protein
MVRHLAVVSQTARVTVDEVAAVSAAIQKQVVRDFAPEWGAQATVQAFPSLEQTPSDYCPVVIRDDIGVPGVAGIHRGSSNQPYALVQHGDRWSVRVSHEVLELLVDPSLDRVVAGPSLRPGQGRVQYLVEVCDPCQDDHYEVNGVAVSDFCTQAYFSPVAGAGVAYNFCGTIKKPRGLRPGGYLSWLVPETGDWWMGFLYQGAVQFLQIQRPDGAISLREFIDHESERVVPRRRPSRRPRPVVSPAVQRAAAARAAAFERDILSVLQDLRARHGLRAGAGTRRGRARRRR